MTQPSAEVTPGKRGTTAHFSPISLIMAETCSAPPPPNGMAANLAGSCPRSIETRRMAPAMRASATRTIASAACIRSSLSGSPTCVAIARLAASTSSALSLPPIGRAALMRPSTTWASVSVGRVVALAVAGRAPARSRRFPGRPAAGRRGRPRRSSRRRRRWW